MRPGDSVILMDSEQLRCYVKTCDVNGMCNLKAYDLIEPIEQAPTAAAPTIDTSQFVTRKELQEVLQPLQAATEAKNKNVL